MPQVHHWTRRRALVDFEEYRRDILSRIAETRRSLEPLEKGELRLATPVKRRDRMGRYDRRVD
jgi:hypothetical protein